MKVSSLFNLIRDASDLLDFFENVESPEQLISRLERLKRQDSRNLLACVDGLRASVDDALEDTLEMSAADTDATVLEDDNDSDLTDDSTLDLNRLIGEDEKQNSAPAAPPENEKTDPP
jgi:hypothetical protein